MSAYLFGGQTVRVGVLLGILIEEAYVPDGWDGEPLALVVHRSGRKVVVGAWETRKIEPATLDEAVDTEVRDTAWALSEQRAATKRRATA